MPAVAIMPPMNNAKLVGKSIRLPISPEQEARWEAMLAIKKISQQDALYAIMDWFVVQEPLIQSVILGQIPPDPEIQRILISRLDAKRQSGGLRGKSGGH